MELSELKTQNFITRAQQSKGCFSFSGNINDFQLTEF